MLKATMTTLLNQQLWPQNMHNVMLKLCKRMLGNGEVVIIVVVVVVAICGMVECPHSLCRCLGTKQFQ